MAKIKITISEIYVLNQELLGVINQSTGEKLTNGLMSAELSMVTKFKLNSLLNEISSHVKSVDTVRNEIIDKYGEIDSQTGQKVVEYYKKNEDGSYDITEVGKILDEQMAKLYEQDVEIDVMDLTISDIDFKTTEVYPVMFSLIEKLSKKE